MKLATDEVDKLISLLQSEPHPLYSAAQAEHPTDLSRLEEYLQSPRDSQSPLIRELAGSAPLFSRKRRAESLSRAALCFAIAIAYDERLTSPGNCVYARAVFCYALDDAHKTSASWLNRVACDMARVQRAPQSREEKRLSKMLNEDILDTQARLPESVARGADGWAFVYRFAEQSLLPNACLPSDRIVPFFISDGASRKPKRRFFLIPGQYYTPA